MVMSGNFIFSSWFWTCTFFNNSILQSAWKCFNAFFLAFSARNFCPFSTLAACFSVGFLQRILELLPEQLRESLQQVCLQILRGYLLQEDLHQWSRVHLFVGFCLLCFNSIAHRINYCCYFSFTAF